MICSKCLEEYKFTDVHYEEDQSKYVLYFACLCPEPLPVDEDDLDGMDLTLSEDELDYIHEHKIGDVKSQMMKKENLGSGDK